MVFSSAVFLFVFLPAVWLLHTLIPARFLGARNVLLCAASLLFYAYGEPIYIFLMLGSVLLNYLAAILIGGAVRRGRDRLRRFLTVCAVVLNLGILGFFKYVPWLVSLANAHTPLSLPVPGFVMPIGISFYTFQILSYVLDVSRGEAEVQRNYLKLLLYISFFPQLIAGPIVSYNDIREQLTERRTTLEGTAAGIRRFVFGLSKKLLISNTAAALADAAFGSDSPSAALAWLGAFAYCIQIYFDFSGYSDMAVGLASLFGFRIGENFNYPYSAVSIRDFWKRWHISLTNWFRSYVYIPLGGNRKGEARTVLNRYLVFFLTGFWHGANFTYILWGLWHGSLMMFERVTRFDRLTEKKAFRPIARIYTLLCVAAGFVMFRAESLSAGFSFLGAMFAGRGSPSDLGALLTPWAVVVLLCGVVLSAPTLPTVRRRMEAGGDKMARVWSGVEFVLCLPFFALCVMTLASSSFNPFIYYIF
ncbi:MAG: MBOAT family protein [Ruminococcaceae bacterium]|nr:MBOAT family protein [Oscillospiraceae bacterium]